MTIGTLLPSAYGDGGAGVLDTLYGTPQALGGNPVAALQQAVKNRDKGIAAAAAEPQAKREIAAFRAAVARCSAIPCCASW